MVNIDREPKRSRQNDDDDPFSEWQKMIEPLQGKEGESIMSWFCAHLIRRGDKSKHTPPIQQEETEPSSQDHTQVIEITTYKAVYLPDNEVFERTCGGEKGERIPFKEMTPAIKIIKSTRIEGSPERTVTPSE